MPHRRRRDPSALSAPFRWIGCLVDVRSRPCGKFYFGGNEPGDFSANVDCGIGVSRPDTLRVEPFAQPAASLG